MMFALTCLLYACVRDPTANFCVRTGHSVGYCVSNSSLNSAAIPWRTNSVILKTITENCSMPSAALALTFSIASKHNFTRQCYVFLADNIIDGTLPTFNLSKLTSTVPIIDTKPVPS